LNTNYETERTLEYVQRLIQMRVAGIILMIAEFDEALIVEAKRRKTSFVFQDLGVVGERVSNIILDYAVGVDEAVQHLVSLGHTDIFILPVLTRFIRPVFAGKHLSMR